MITFMDPKEKTKENYLDSQMWHACAGGMVQIPSVNSKVFYFPQGHAEHSSSAVDFSTCLRVPSYIPCNVSYVKFMADPDTDEVYAKIGLIPVGVRDMGEWEGDDGDVREVEGVDKPSSFAKTLTQSDANNGGGFSVPRYCAETIFPKLDYTADPPVQAIHAMDVHGEIWKFRHIYRGTPRRHLLTTGWSTFVNHKKLVAGDSIVFLKSENGDICVGIRRAKRGIGAEIPSGWNSSGSRHVGPYVGFSSNCHDDERRLLSSNGGNSVICHSSGNMVMGRWGRVSSESVLEAALSAGNGLPFEVVYYPRASTPEFCVKAGLVKEALQIRWCSAMRFKMAFETEDSSRISWFMGTISSVQVVDPIRWPDSPWRLLQVTWDEPDLLQNVKGVSPWLVEMVSNMPPIHLSPFSPSRKKPRLPFTQSFTLDNRLPLLPSFANTIIGPSVPNNNNNLLSNKSPAGMQGARHNQSGLPLSEHQFQELQPSTLFPSGFPSFLRSGAPDRTVIHSNNETVSCLLTMAVPTHTPEKTACEKTVGEKTAGEKTAGEKTAGEKAAGEKTAGEKTAGEKTAGEKTVGEKTAGFFLFGQPILTEQQMSLSSDTSHICTGNSSSEGNPDKVTNVSDASGSSPLQSFNSCCLDTDPGMTTTRHCSEFVRSARAMTILMDRGRDGVRM